MPHAMNSLPENAVLLHIGPHKTGTTAIQTTLAPARDELAALGVTYPGQYTAHHLEAYSLRQYSQAWAGSDEEPPGPEVFDRFARRVAETSGRVVVSSEFFAGCTEAERGRLVEELGGERVHVVLGARNPAAFALSTWQQLLREGKADAFDTWLERDFRRPVPTRADGGFWSKADPSILAGRWRDLVGADRVTVVALGEGDRTTLPHTFEQLLALPEGFLSARRPANSNRGISGTEAEFLRQVQAALGDDLTWSDHTVLIRSGLVRQLQRARTRGPEEAGPVLPDWAQEQTGHEVVAIADALAELGVRIAGDLESLAGMPAGGTDEPLAVVPVDLAVQAAVGTIRSAQERFRVLEGELARERERSAAATARVAKVRRRNARLQEQVDALEQSGASGLMGRFAGRRHRQRNG